VSWAMELSTQFQSGDVTLKDIPFDRFVALARHVLKQAIKDAVKGDPLAAQWIESRDALLWAEVCEVDQLWPPDLRRLPVAASGS